MTTTRRVHLIAGAAAAFVTVIWYLIVFSPQAHHLRTAHAQKAKAEQNVADLHGQIGRLQSLLPQVPADRAALAALQASVPDHPDLAGALDQLNAAAAHSGVVISQVSPAVPTSASASASPAAKSGGLQRVGFGINATGNYAQIMAFVSALDSSSRAFTISNLALSSGGAGSAAGSSLSATMTAAVFSNVPAGS